MAREEKEEAARQAFRKGELGLDRYKLRPLLDSLGVRYVSQKELHGGGHRPMSGIPCLLIRGGTSKGAYFEAEDLPADPAERDDLLLRIMGSPDPRQIDGIGGGHPLTSKVAVISPSEDPNADVDYLFLQVSVDKAEVSDSQNCGNLLAGVGPFAVERGLVAGRRRSQPGADPDGQL